MPESNLKDGQRVWHKGRPATFRYLLRGRAAVVHFDGRPEPSVVNLAALSLSPPDDTRIARLSLWFPLVTTFLPPVGIDFPF